MPDFASSLKTEIIRLARKEVRSEVEGLRKASAQYRSDIAGLKRSLAALQKQIATLTKSKTRISELNPKPGSSSRFSAKGLSAFRKRLKISAAELGALMDVAPQTIYNWESGKTRPGHQQVAALAGLRKMGRRQVSALLKEKAEAA